MRKIGTFFRKSPKRMEVLMKYTHKAPIKDCKTRWDTMLASLRRFVDTQDPISHALQDLKKRNMHPEEDEITFIEQIVAALEIVECASKELQKRDCTLAEADRIFELSLGDLSELESDFSKMLYAAVEERILERRKTVLSTLQAYLEDPSFLDSKNLILPMASRTEITRAAEELLIRLYPEKASPRQVDGRPSAAFPRSRKRTGETPEMPSGPTRSDQRMEDVSDKESWQNA